MSIDRSGHQTVLMPNGKVLVVGGESLTTSAHRLSSAELFDYNSGEFTPTGSMSEARTGHIATVLDDGKVLISGGFLSSAEVYEPSSGAFRTVGSMNSRRHEHTATKLEDGRVLIVGGRSFDDQGRLHAFAQSELFSPTEEAFSITGSLTTSRSEHTATRLLDGRVLVLGGRNNLVLKSAEIYDPATETFAEIGELNEGRFAHTATLLPDGKVLIVGGRGGETSPTYATELDAVELFDPATNNSTSLPALSGSPLVSHSATSLSNGQILFIGIKGCGTSAPGLPPNPCPFIYLYDIDSATFETRGWGEAYGRMNLARNRHSASLLPGGDVLITGGHAGEFGWTDTAEILFVPD